MDNERSDIIYFLSCMSDEWSPGRWRPSQFTVKDGAPSRPVEKFIVIRGPLGSEFTLYCDRAFRYVKLYHDPRKFDKGSFVAGTRVEGGITFEWETPEHLVIRLRHSRETLFPAAHPLGLLTARVLSLNNLDRIHPGIARLFPTATVDRLVAEQASRAAKDNLKHALEDLCEGYVKFYYYVGDGFGLLPVTIGDKKKKQGVWKLFGLTWVFPWAIPLLGQLLPGCFESDGTFKSLKPYVLEIWDAIFANESIPIGLGVTPTETATSYLRLYGHILEVLVNYGHFGEQYLKAFPFLSDQGAALREFVTTVGLLWLWCHRHLIEGGGAAGLAGDWIRRLLKCGSLEDAQAEARVIAGEIEAIKAAGQKPFAKACTQQLVLSMIAAAMSNCTSHLTLWARWWRLFCPTTTNALEAFHAVLNHAIHDVKTFISRLRNIKECIWARFNDRDKDKRVWDRAANRWIENQEKKKTVTTEGNRVFYERLHTFRRPPELMPPWAPMPPPVGKNWGFPRLPTIPTEFPQPEWIPINERLPPEWQTPPTPEQEAAWAESIDVAVQAPAVPVAREVETGPGNGETVAYLTAGRRIIKTIRNLHKNEAKWKDKKTRDGLAADVWGFGAALNLYQLKNIEAAQEVGWRLRVYDKYGVLRTLPPVS
jgi:hypothetical protein